MKRILLAFLLSTALAGAQTNTTFYALPPVVTPASADVIPESQVSAAPSGRTTYKITLAQLQAFCTSGLTITTTTGTFTIANGKTLTANNSLTFSGTDGSTLNIGAGGTLGSNAFTSTAFVPATTTINGHALTANIVISASDLTTGTLPIGQIPTGSSSSTVAIGNDTRFPASVTGLRKGAGAGSSDTAAVQADITALISGLYQPLNANLTSWSTITRGTGVDAATAIPVNTAGGNALVDLAGNHSAANFGLNQGTATALTKIVCIGDSITQLGNATSYPNQLQGMGVGANCLVYNLGLTGYTEVQIASLYSASQAYSAYPLAQAGTYSPHSLAGSNELLIDHGGTNDADAISAGLNSVVASNCTTNGTTTITNVGTITNIEVGGYIRATDFASTPTATVVSKSTASGGTVVMSAAATGSHTGQSIQFATETLADFQTAWQSIASNAHTDGYKVARMWLLPRAVSTDTALTNTIVTQINTWMAGQQGTAGAHWDFDIHPEYTMTNGANTYYFDWVNSPMGIHPNAIGHNIMAATAAARIQSPSIYGVDHPYYPFTTAGILNQWLQADVVFNDVANTFVQGQVINRTVSNTTPSLLIHTAASVTGDGLTLDGVSGTSNSTIAWTFGLIKQWTLSMTGTNGSSNLVLTNNILGGGTQAIAIDSATDTLQIGPLSCTYVGVNQGSGSGIFLGTSGAQDIKMNNAFGGNTTITLQNSGATHDLITNNTGYISFYDPVNSVTQFQITNAAGTTGGISTGGSLSVAGTSSLTGQITASNLTASTIIGTDASKHLVSKTVNVDYLGAPTAPTAPGVVLSEGFTGNVTYTPAWIAQSFQNGGVNTIVPAFGGTAIWTGSIINAASLAFDGTLNNNPWRVSNTGSCSIGYHFAAPQIVTSYVVFPAYQGAGFSYTVNPKNWTFQGSNDGSTWTTLDTQTNQTTWTEGTGVTYSFTNSTPYLYYQLASSVNGGGGATAIDELQFYSNLGSAGDAVLTTGNLVIPGNSIKLNGGTLNGSLETGKIPVGVSGSSSTAAVTNTTSETTLVPTGGSATIGANVLVPGANYKIHARGIINNTGTPTLEIKAKLGSVVIADTTAFTTVSIAGNNVWTFDCDIACNSIGASGTVYAQGAFNYFSAATTSNPVQAGNSTATTIDTTASKALGLTATWGTASSSNSITCTNLTFERVY